MVGSTLQVRIWTRDRALQLQALLAIDSVLTQGVQDDTYTRGRLSSAIVARALEKPGHLVQKLKNMAAGISDLTASDRRAILREVQLREHLLEFLKTQQQEQLGGAIHQKLQQLPPEKPYQTLVRKQGVPNVQTTSYAVNLTGSGNYALLYNRKTGVLRLFRARVDDPTRRELEQLLKELAEKCLRGTDNDITDKLLQIRDKVTDVVVEVLSSVVTEVKLPVYKSGDAHPYETEGVTSFSTIVGAALARIRTDGYVGTYAQGSSSMLRYIRANRSRKTTGFPHPLWVAQTSSSLPDATQCARTALYAMYLRGGLQCNGVGASLPAVWISTARIGQIEEMKVALRLDAVPASTSAIG